MQIDVSTRTTKITETLEADVSPCTCCGLDIALVIVADNVSHQVGCRGCGARGGQAVDAKAAIKRWNKAWKRGAQ